VVWLVVCFLLFCGGFCGVCGGGGGCTFFGGGGGGGGGGGVAFCWPSCMPLVLAGPFCAWIHPIVDPEFHARDRLFELVVLADGACCVYDHAYARRH